MISSTHDIKKSFAKYEYNLPLPPSANKVEIFKDDYIHSNLLGIIQITKSVYDVNFNGKCCGIMDRKTKKILSRVYLDPMTNLYYMTLINTAHDVTTPVCLGLISQNTYNTLSVLRDSNHRVALNLYEDQFVSSLIKYLHTCAWFPVSYRCIESITKGYYMLHGLVLILKR